MKCFNYFWLVVASLLMALPANAQLPESGLYIPQLDIFDQTMQQVMSTNEIDSGVLAVSVNSIVVYQRGFGIDIPENTPMRLASVEKPITAAAVWKLFEDNAVFAGDRVFDLGSGDGILQHVPWQGLGDARLANITVLDLMNHLGGWNACTAPIGDPQFKTREIAAAMGIGSPADRDAIIRYMLSQPLQFNPGVQPPMDPDCSLIRNGIFGRYCYSNFGYMVLGRVVEEVSGMPLLDFFRTRVLTPEMWVPNQELITGRSLPPHNAREPYYLCWNLSCDCECQCTSVFPPFGNVPCPYGGFQIEAFKGHGNLVASAVPLLKYMDNYDVGVQSDAGAPIQPGDFGGFNGGMSGTSSSVLQRSDGINIVVLFPRQNSVSSSNLAGDAANIISSIINNGGIVWPTFDVDGFWVDFEATPVGMEVGGFDYPVVTMNQALHIGAGAKLRLKPGSSNWTGVITHKVQIDAPFGTATIGVN